MSPNAGPYFVLFGSSELDLERCRALLEQTLGLVFEGHASGFLGEYYLAGLPGGEHFECT
jgi:hypothetical protein